jgi:tyrosyl-tRNA synthetase
VSGAESFLDELAWRGLLHQVTSDALGAHLASGRRTGYAGFDPTSDSLTVGNFIPIKLLAHLQRHGHRPIVLMGGGTGLIGDPSGKSSERQLLSAETVAANVARQREIFARVLDLSPTLSNRATILDNAAWLGKLGYLEVLRDVGKHFSVNAMIQRDSVASRLREREQGISYTEFSYMILQAYDFLHLRRAEGCTLQMGGSDQFGNIVSGVDLIRRHEGSEAEAFGLTAPLLVKSDGTKFGKTESGAVWLTADRTSPYAFHQYWLNVADADVGKLLRTLTFLDRATIEGLEHAVVTRPQEREAQRRLAREMTSLLHGPTEADRAEAAAKALFSGELRGLDERTLGEVFGDVPHSTHAIGELGGEGTPLVDLLPLTSLVASKREAREFLQAGAISVNGEKAAADRRLATADLLPGGRVLLRRGKKQWHATAWK